MLAATRARGSCATCRPSGLIRPYEAAARAKTRRRRAWRAPFATTTTAASTSPARVRGATRQQKEIGWVEGLYTSGQITREEWRSAVVEQAGLAGADDGGDEARVRALRAFYGGAEVPGDLLDEGERRVHERLFGRARELDVPGEELDHEAELGEGEDAGAGAVAGADGPACAPPRPHRMHPNERLAADMERAFSSPPPAPPPTASHAADASQRTHPLTLANRFATQPSTLELPHASLVEPIAAMLESRSARQRATQLGDAARRIFGGPGLPYSTSTPVRGQTMQPKAIPLDAGMSRMSDIEGDVYMSTIVPGVYSSVMGVLVETRKRLGSAWAEALVRKAEAGDLRILDAGGAGAGVLAVREMLRAEWERMHHDPALPHATRGAHRPTALAEADGRAGGEPASARLGEAMVLTGSDVLRHRASRLLQNTTFVPRLPDYLHAEIGARGKFDIVVAPHTLWPLREDYVRKTHVQNLWSLLSVDGGVLVLLEKGVARGFEMIAGARDLLLASKIASPGSTAHVACEPKETGMIIAPCTNHTGCPLYVRKGAVAGRREICAFPQRYHRPEFLQKIWGAKGKNHEDVEFSYLSVMRGKDLRAAAVEPQHASPSAHEAPPPGFVQDARSTDRAFAGYEHHSTESSAPDHPPPPNSLTLPRAIFPPLKRHGHVIIDLCTSAGTLERWTVPRSYSKQAFRDARKASWGDLWALGAKTRVPRNIKASTRSETDHADPHLPSAREQAQRHHRLEQLTRSGAVRLDADEHGRIVPPADDDAPTRRRRKLKGVRDPRDKKADGNGRRKRSSRLLLDQA